MLLESQESEFGFDTDVEEIKASNEESVYDASRNKVKFFGAVVATGTPCGGARAVLLRRG